MKILSETVVTAAEAKAALEKRNAEALTYEQKICLDYLKKTPNIPAEKAIKLLEDVLKIGRLSRSQAAAVANILPQSEEEVKQLFSKERLTLKPEELKQIADTVKGYL